MTNAGAAVTPVEGHHRPDRVASGRRQHYLQAGEVFASAEPIDVVTILGSCVAVCLYDPVARVGGMNHFLLPHAVHRESSPRFGAVAVARLIEEMVRAGAHRDRLQAKVFGGACVIAALRAGASHIGQQNAELAFRLLAAERIVVVDQDVGETQGRKLVFHVDDGSAWVRRL